MECMYNGYKYISSLIVLQLIQKSSVRSPNIRFVSVAPILKRSGYNQGWIQTLKKILYIENKIILFVKNYTTFDISCFFLYRIYTFRFCFEYKSVYN